MKILITGGLGFIGSNLIEYLLTKTNVKKILIVDNFSQNTTKYLKSFTKFKYFSSPGVYIKSNSKVQVIRANIKNNQFASTITMNIDYVIHLAAESGVDASINNPRDSFENNVIGAFNYLNAAKINKAKGFIFPSSGAVFGDIKPPMHEKLPRIPISPYGSSKLSGETFCETFSNVFKLNTTILRFSNAYGNYSGHKKSVVAKFIQNIINNKPLAINGDGKHTRDFIHVEDICSAIYKSIKNKERLQIYNVATGHETSINKLIILLKKVFKKYNKTNIKIKHNKARIGDMRRNFSSPTKIKKELKWKPKINLYDGLIKTVQWYLGGNK